MSGKNRNVATIILLAGCVSSLHLRHSRDVRAGQTEPAGQQPAAANKDQKPAESGSTLDIPDRKPPVNAEEDAAVKAFQAMPSDRSAKKIAAGEDFLTQVSGKPVPPDGVFRAGVCIYPDGQRADKALEVGDKEVALKPDDVQTMAILSQTIPRAMNAEYSGAGQSMLAKAETYAKRAIEITPTHRASRKDMADQNFVVAKNETLAMAHSGLGLVYFRRGKFNEAIPELEQSVKIDPNPTPDPVNLVSAGNGQSESVAF